MSEACLATEGIKLVAQLPQTKEFLRRMNCLDLCGIVYRIRAAHGKLLLTCDFSFESETTSSSSSSECCLPEVSTAPDILHLIKVDDLDAEVYSLLADLEAEYCDAIRELKEMETLLNLQCFPDAPSSSSESSSETPSSSCCEVPTSIEFVGEFSAVLAAGNPTVYSPPFLDGCSVYNVATETGFTLFAYNKESEFWSLYQYNNDSPFEITLLSEADNDNDSCTPIGVIINGSVVIEPTENPSSISDSSSSSGEVTCITGGLALFSSCELSTLPSGAYDFSEPSTYETEGFGPCGFLSDDESILVRYNNGGFWEIVYDSAVIAIRTTLDSGNPKGEYQYSNALCADSYILIS